jgi:hypothetical protein
VPTPCTSALPLVYGALDEADLGRAAVETFESGGAIPVGERCAWQVN